MPKTYEAMYNDGRLRWIGHGPPGRSLKLRVTVIEDEEGKSEGVKARLNVLQRTRGCAKPPMSRDDIDLAVREMRNEWRRDWDE
jgi:hypothetical protein